MGRLDTKALLLAVGRAAAITTLTLKTSRYIPRGIKWFVLFLVALNRHSFPLLWHSEFQDPMCFFLNKIHIFFTVRVLVPWFSGILKQKFVKRTRGRGAHLRRLTSISPVGMNPLDAVETWKSRASQSFLRTNHAHRYSSALHIRHCRL